MKGIMNTVEKCHCHKCGDTNPDNFNYNKMGRRLSDAWFTCVKNMKAS